MVELSKAVECLDVASHLKVRLGTDVVAGVDLRGIRSVSRCQDKDQDPCYQQGLQGSLQIQCCLHI